MKEFHRKSELIVEGLSITLTTFVDRAFTLVELNAPKEQITIHDGGITTAFDSDELDEIILMLQDARDALKRAEIRD